MSEGFRLIATGIVLGFLAAIPFADLIATQLYGVSTHDALIYADCLSLAQYRGIIRQLLFSAARNASRSDDRSASRIIIRRDHPLFVVVGYYR